ncbi:SRPBCC family protein [Maribellus sp. YY47]|uniref:SRPBCC family protein n=1 Tax=Maribellus sp. YY47 TaxID=2929486 RepID=UPI002000942F|nr:SRPBCC family protein [Maribellus sp. YY47]MCK3683192.1 SRPBCC family protein [Maribellus sp. YY47]
MTKIAHSVLLNTPLEEVFEYASDWKKWEEWFEGVSDFQSISEVEKGKGAKYRYKAKMMMFKYEIEAEVYEYTENVGFKVVGIKGPPYKSFWNFEVIDGKTKFTYGLEYSISTPIIGNYMDAWFLKPQWNKIIQNSLQNLSKKIDR